MTQNERSRWEAFLLDDTIASQMTVKKDEPLSMHCSFRIGGKADYLVTPSTAEVFAKVVSFLRENGIRYFIIGKGSNLLFDDEGFRGVILSTLGLNEVSINEREITAGAGVSLNHLAVCAEKAGLGGMECLHGIPGSVGGAVYMNAGAYDGEVSMVLKSVECLEIDSGRLVTIDACDCDLSYRHSRFQSRNHVILSATFTLSPADPVGIREKMDDLMQRRIDKQPLNYPSAGSTFKRYPGKFTAQMIDEAGLKGFMIGGAQVSEKHAGFLINKANATSKDMLSLIEKVRQTVMDIHGVLIQCEVEYLTPEKTEGDFKEWK